MILKELKIKNFRSYYGEKIFSFKDGLTLIIGGNGDGKTTFFDALFWLFNTNDDGRNGTYISEKRKSQISDGEMDTVSVSLNFEHNGLKAIEKKFIFEKNEKGKIIVKDFSFQGWDGQGSERVLIPGAELLERCFDAVIRKYCLFKGESDLNIFSNSQALKTLVDKFSNIRQFDDYVNLLARFEAKSDRAYRKEMRNDKNVSERAGSLDSQLADVNNKITNTKRDITQQKQEAIVYERRIAEFEQHHEACKKYQSIKRKIAAINNKLSKINDDIDERYNTKLLDDLWILAPFPEILRQFRQKIANFDKEKRRLSLEFEKAQVRKETIAEVTAIANGAIPLSNFVPNGETMQEMINDEICKVCNRKAEKGSQAYNFMLEKLANYEKEITAKNHSTNKDCGVSPFEHSFIEELCNLCNAIGDSRIAEIAHLQSYINEKIELNSKLKVDRNSCEYELKEAIEEKGRILIQANGVSEDFFEAKFTDLKGFFDQKARSENRLHSLQLDLDRYSSEKLKLDEEYECLPSTGKAKIYSKIHKAFAEILKASENAKLSNLRDFLKVLEERANDYLKKLNKDDFHGVIKLNETHDESVCIQLCSDNGEKINDPNGALQTTMYMSILFAISDLTTLKREVDYPLIFDAPTSSFESYKEEDFYNIVDKINKQCIIVTKDLLDVDESGEKKLNMVKINQLTCSVYRIKKQTPFTSSDLSTIATIIEPIK